MAGIKRLLSVSDEPAVRGFWLAKGLISEGPRYAGREPPVEPVMEPRPFHHERHDYQLRHGMHEYDRLWKQYGTDNSSRVKK